MWHQTQNNKMSVIVLDLNGVLVDREYIGKDEFNERADMHVINKYGSRWNVYFKNRARQFIDLINKSDYTIVVWSSACKENVKPIVDELFKYRMPDLFFTQEDCLVYGRTVKPEFIKFYDKILSLGFKPSDLIFVDDDFYKVRFNGGSLYVDPTGLTLTELWMLIDSPHRIQIEHVSHYEFLKMVLYTSQKARIFVSIFLFLTFVVTYLMVK